MSLDEEFCKFMMRKNNFANLGVNYFKHNFASEYLIFSEAFNLQQTKIDQLQNTLKLLTSSNPVASELFGKAAARQLLGT